MECLEGDWELEASRQGCCFTRVVALAQGKMQGEQGKQVQKLKPVAGVVHGVGE